MKKLVPSGDVEATTQYHDLVAFPCFTGYGYWQASSETGCGGPPFRLTTTGATHNKTSGAGFKKTARQPPGKAYPAAHSILAISLCM